MTKGAKTLETKLQKIAERSVKEPGSKFDKLMPLFSPANLTKCFYDLRRGCLAGIDGVSWKDYESKLEANIADLHGRLKSMSYRPGAVRQVMIPKDQGGFRPLGISGTEDKIIQLMFSKILTAIFDPHFIEESYGFRKNKRAHEAVKDVRNYLFSHHTPVVIDADIKNFFGTLDHQHLLAFVGHRIADETFLRYIVRLLRSGIFKDGNFIVTDEGSPQGAVCSPILSNIYAHYVIDLWFKHIVSPRIPGCKLVRYADDFVICCPNQGSAKRIREVLGKRLGKFALELSETKTKVADLSKARTKSQVKSDVFDFLGFTFYLGKSIKGFTIPKVKTSKVKFRSKLKRVSEWVKSKRNEPFKETWKNLNRKLVGHVAYYGVSHNSLRVHQFIKKAQALFFKWMNRRSQKRSITWEKFNQFMKINPGAKARIYYPLFSKTSVKH